MLQRLLFATVVTAALAAQVQAQFFVHLDFNAAPWLVKTSYGPTQPPVAVTPPGVVGFAVRVTSTSPGAQRGALWHGTPLRVSTGFDTSFGYSTSGASGGGGEGLAFVIHVDGRATDAIGRHGAGLGYAGLSGAQPGDAIANSLVIEFDTFDSGSAYGDPDGSHISVHTRGSADNDAHEDASLGRWSSPAVGTAGNHEVRVRYVPGTLEVYFDDPFTPKLTIPYDFATGGTHVASGAAVGGLALVAGQAAYAGFTASTDVALENHDITSWIWNSDVPGQSLYCYPGTTSAGCVPVLSTLGEPSASAPSGFTLHVANVPGAESAMLFYGISGRTFQPWGSPLAGAVYCVQSPVQRMSVVATGGTAGQCDGTLSADWRAFTQRPAALGFGLPAGSVVQTQGWYRDPPSTKHAMLSGAIEFTLTP